MSNPPWWTIGDRVEHPENVGQHGNIIELDEQHHRARVKWDFRAPRTWLSWYRLKSASSTPKGNNASLPETGVSE